MKLNELDPEQHIKSLVYGDSGSGKSVFASGFPGPVHYFDFDGKVSSVASYLKGKPKLNEISYESYLASTDAGKRFNDDLEKLKALGKAGDFPYGTIVLDSLTTFTDEAMKYLMKMNTGIKRPITRGAQVPVLQDWGIARLFFKQVINEILAMPCNVIVTAHIQESRDELTGQILRNPMMPGKLAKELPIYFAEVYRTYVKDGKYYAQTQSDRDFVCRTQLGLKSPIELNYNNLIGG